MSGGRILPPTGNDQRLIRSRRWFDDEQLTRGALQRADGAGATLLQKSNDPDNGPAIRAPSMSPSAIPGIVRDRSDSNLLDDREAVTRIKDESRRETSHSRIKASRLR